jgi:uncharacterized protein
MNLDFPFHFDIRGQTATTDDNNHIRDLIEQFLFTNQGERVNRPDFGSGLLEVIFEPNSPKLIADLQRIKSGLQHWLDDLIDLDELDIVSEEAEVHILVRYQVRDDPEGKLRELKRTVPL